MLTNSDAGHSFWGVREALDPESGPDDLVPFFSPSQVAVWLGVTEDTLAKLRRSGGGPRFIIVHGNQVRYHKPDLIEWVNSSKADIALRRKGRAA